MRLPQRIRTLSTTLTIFSATAQFWLFLAPAQAQTSGSKAQILTQATTPPLCPAQLGAAIDRITNRLPQVRWGVLVQTQGQNASRQTLFARNPEVPLIPASNNKLLTTAAALQKLGAPYRIRTAVFGNTGQPTLTTLRIVGQGDPSLTTTQLAQLAQQLRQKGIRQITQLIGDDTYFQGIAINPNWDPEDTLAGYGAAVNSLILNQNAIGLTLLPQRVGQPLRVQWDDPSEARDWQLNNRSLTVAANQAEYVDALRDPNQWLIQVEGQLQVGSEPEPIAVSVPNPGNYLIQKFRAALSSVGIAVGSATVVKATPAPPGAVELAAIESPPLSQLLIETNQESNNLFAEALLKTIGRVQTPNNSDATASGIAAVKTILAPLGVNAARYTMVDGSGLSDRNRVSPSVLVQTLQAMAQSSSAQVYRTSLPIAGVSGTLKNRFRNTAAQGRLQAKTGTISGVVALSGYLTPPNYGPIVFSILTNASGSSPSNLRSTVDEIVLVLIRLRSC